MRDKKKKEKEIRQLSPEELLEEERRYQACKKPVKIGWHIYACATIVYVINMLVASKAIQNLPQERPVVETLNDYRASEEYADFLTSIQKEATDKFTRGEISIEECQHIIETSSSDEKFEEFLRGLENDPRVQRVLADYDEFDKAYRSINSKYRVLALTSLSGILVANVILAKYRFREMDIEDARKKRAEALGKSSEEDTMQ